MRILQSIKLRGWILLLPLLLGGCSPSDDVQAIFTGKTWKMTYISYGQGASWYKFPGLTDSDYKAYDPVEGTKSFTITFTGSETDHTIAGSFTGAGSVSTNGSWSANGESSAFSATIKGNPIIGSGDKIGAKIIEVLKAADKYSGDEDGLFIHCTYEKDRIFMAFKPVKQ